MWWTSCYSSPGSSATMVSGNVMDANLQITWELCSDGLQKQKIYLFIYFFFLLDTALGSGSFKSLQGFFRLLLCLYAKERGSCFLFLCCSTHARTTLRWGFWVMVPKSLLQRWWTGCKKSLGSWPIPSPMLEPWQEEEELGLLLKLLLLWKRRWHLHCC